MESLVGRYHPPDGVYDEMFGQGDVRSSYRISRELLAEMPDSEFVERADYVRSTYLDQGITFDVGGKETPFPLDVVPRIITAKDFALAGKADRLAGAAGGVGGGGTVVSTPSQTPRTRSPGGKPTRK